MIKRESHNNSQKQTKARIHYKNKFVEEQTGSDTPKKLSFKMKFTQWLKQLPLDERYLAVKVHAPGLSNKIQEALMDVQNEQIQQSRKDGPVNSKISSKQTKQIIESIVLITDGQQYFDNIGFDFTYIQHPEKLYQLLTSTLSQPQKLMYQTQLYQIQVRQMGQIVLELQKCQSKQQLALTVMSFLRGEIFIKFEQKRSINLEEERNRKKEFSIFWRNLPQQYKKKILLLHRQDLKALASFLAQKKIHLDAQDLQKQFSQLIQLDKNQFCNKIFKCKLKRSLTYLTDYHELVYKSWKAQLNRRKRKLRNQQSSNAEKPLNSPNSNNSAQRVQDTVKLNKIQKQLQANQGKKQQCPQEITIDVSNNDKTDSLCPTGNGQKSKRKRNRNNRRRKKSVSAESKQTKATTYKFVQDEVQKSAQGQRADNKQPFQPREGNQNTLQATLIAQGPFGCTAGIGRKPTNSLTSKASEQIEIPLMDFQSQMYEKVRSDIQEYSDLINQEANLFYQRRVIAYERIQFMLDIWKIPIKLFGSCASGITIKNSDIDIAVDNSILNYFLPIPQNSRLKAALQQLEQFLQQQPWVTSLKLIKTAAIPLIKMKVDTSINLSGIPGFQIYPPCLQTLNREHLSPGQILIDLTIETINKQLQCNHLGIISTDQINNWLKTIKPLHSIIIIIKNYLTKMNLNITYQGGLNTYSMICMLVAFIKSEKLENQTDSVKVFQKILKFYAYEFDQKIKGIDLLNQQEIFYDKLKVVQNRAYNSQNSKLPQPTQPKSTAFCQADFQIKDPLNNGKNMTRNCYSFTKIKQVFQKIHQECFIQTENKLQSMFVDSYRNKYQIGHTKIKQDDKQVRQLLLQCRNKLNNPFLTLFE